MGVRMWIFFGAGLTLSIVGSCVLIFWPTLLYSILSKELYLSNHSRSVGEWTDSTMPMRMEVYLFNWTNPGGVNKDGSLKDKPILQQTGPYVFTEQRHKVILGWNEGNDTVTYFQNRTWFWDPMLSNGSLDDLITTVNVPAITAAAALRYSPGVSFLVNVAYKVLGIQLHTTKSVREFVFDGYTNPIMDIADKIPKQWLPFAIPFDKFGWFYQRNGTASYDGAFNMETGKKDIGKLGKLSAWNYMKKTHYFQSYCGEVNGSAGELFGPSLPKTTLSFFSSDLCRPIPLIYEGQVRTETGISAYRFKGDPILFSNATSVPDNWCFSNMSLPYNQPNGVLNISTCKWGSPVFASFPHFYGGDPVLLEPVKGLSPDPALHKMILDLEPVTGVPVHASAAMQINVFLQSLPHFTFMENSPRMYFPCIWFKEVADVSGATEDQMKEMGSLASTPILVAYFILAAGISLLLLLGVLHVALRWRRGEDVNYLIAPTNSSLDSDTED